MIIRVLISILICVVGVANGSQAAPVCVLYRTNRKPQSNSGILPCPEMVLCECSTWKGGCVIPVNLKEAIQREVTKQLPGHVLNFEQIIPIVPKSIKSFGEQRWPNQAIEGYTLYCEPSTIRTQQVISTCFLFVFGVSFFFSDVQL